LTPTTTESCAEYGLRLRGNYRDKDMPRYDLNIAIFDTIRYIVPSIPNSNPNLTLTLTNPNLNSNPTLTLTLTLRKVTEV